MIDGTAQHDREHRRRPPRRSVRVAVRPAAHAPRPARVCLNVPHLCYVALSQAATLGSRAVAAATIYAFVSLEKFGYSFGFVGNMLYMMQQIAPGKYPMTHYAFATALMNLVLVPDADGERACSPIASATSASSSSCSLASIPSLIAAARAPFPNRLRADQRGVTSRTHVALGAAHERRAALVAVDALVPHVPVLRCRPGRCSRCSVVQAVGAAHAGVGDGSGWPCRSGSPDRTRTRAPRRRWTRRASSAP